MSGPISFDYLDNLENRRLASAWIKTSIQALKYDTQELQTRLALLATIDFPNSRAQRGLHIVNHGLALDRSAEDGVNAHPQPQLFRTTSSYCTVSVIEVRWDSCPAVAVTITVLVPVGVPVLMGGGVLEPPQATTSEQRVTKQSKVSRRIARRLRLRAPEKTKPKKPGSNMAQYNALPWMSNAFRKLALALGAVVVMVIVAPVEVLVKVQFEFEGSPEHANEKFWLKPSSGVIVSAVSPLCPGAATVTVAGFAVIWKSTTSRRVGAEDEVA